MALTNLYGEQIVIEVVAGGFILTYPQVRQNGDKEYTDQAREVFVSPRKLNQKLKEVIESIGLVADEK